MTCLESMPALISFNATRRLTGSVCCAIQTVPMPPSPIGSMSLYGPMTVPGCSGEPAPGLSWATVPPAATGGASRKLPARSGAASSPAMAARRAALFPHGSRRYASRSAGVVSSSAVRKIDCSRGLSDISITPGCLTYPGAIGAGKGPLNRTLFVPIHFAAQPGAGEGPVALGGARRNVEGLRCLLERETGEEVELDELGHARLLAIEVCQGFVESDQLLVRRRADQLVLEQFNALPVAAALEAFLRPRLLD